jgi:hypothetical protein
MSEKQKAALLEKGCILHSEVTTRYRVGRTRVYDAMRNGTRVYPVRPPQVDPDRRNRSVAREGPRRDRRVIPTVPIRPRRRARDRNGGRLAPTAYLAGD